MNVAPNPPPARGAAIRCDLYCLKCGYNLRRAVGRSGALSGVRQFQSAR